MRAFGSVPSLVVLLLAVGCDGPELSTRATALLGTVEGRIEELAAAAPLREPSRLRDAVLEGPRVPPKPGAALSKAVAAETLPDQPAAPAPSAPPGPDPTAAERGPTLVATSKETVIYARPSPKAPKLGYLRAGAVVSRDPDPAGFDGCRGGFYGIAPEGFVCVGAAASLDTHHELARAAPRRADRTASLPYVYGITATGAPLYSRVPTGEEQRTAEPDRDARKPQKTSFDEIPLDPIPWFLENGAPSISPNGARFSRLAASLGAALPRSGFSFVSLFESEGRRFGLTADMTVVPLDRFTVITPSRFHGVPLDERATLPVAFVRSKSAALYSGDPTTTGLRFDRRLEFREAVSLSGKHARTGGTTYLETREGGWIVDERLLRVDPPAELPPWATGSRTWIDVSIQRQTLVAYEGPRPVFVTLVSTGIDGTGDPETTHSTIQGQFLVHTKHVTITMDSDAVGDEFDLRDVPYVQYFKDGFALHAAYWHDGFGSPRSHGCVNLSPLDARWLFSWTEPPVPSAWHGAMSTRGTLVSVHP